MVIYPQEYVSENRAILRELRAKDVSERHELAVGITVPAACVDGLVGQATVESISTSEIVLSVVFDKAPPLKESLTAIVGVSRPHTIKKVIQVCATMGVSDLHFVPTSLGEKSYLKSKSLLQENIDYEILLGIEQSGDPIPPNVTVHGSFREFSGHALPKILASIVEPPALLLADTHESKPLSRRALNKTSQVFVAVGAETGWSEGEIKAFKAINFQSISLGSRVLRVETALTALIAQVELMRSQNDPLR